MFPGLTEKILKKIHAQEEKIKESKINPHNREIVTAQRELEGIFDGDGRVNPKYAKETIIAYEYSKSHQHFQTGESMLADIIADKRIDFNDYL